MFLMKRITLTHQFSKCYFSLLLRFIRFYQLYITNNHNNHQCIFYNSHSQIYWLEFHHYRVNCLLKNQCFIALHDLHKCIEHKTNTYVIQHKKLKSSTSFWETRKIGENKLVYPLLETIFFLIKSKKIVSEEILKFRSESRHPHHSFIISDETVCLKPNVHSRRKISYFPSNQKTIAKWEENSFSCCENYSLTTLLLTLCNSL